MKTSRVILRFIERELLDGAAPDGDPLAEGLLDSLAREQLAAYLEERFGVVLEGQDLSGEELTSVDRLAARVDAKRSAGHTTR
jgi:acyl carrier protein